MLYAQTLIMLRRLQVAKELSEKLPSARLHVFSDRDLEPKRAQIEAALEHADVFFGSLLFDYDQVEWLKSRVEKIPLRLVFESALELMSTTQIGTFQVIAWDRFWRVHSP